MIDFSLTDEQKLLQKEIGTFAEINLNDGVEYRDQNQIFDRNLWKKCGEIGLPGLAIPVEYGGRGLNALSTVIALEALGSGSKDGGLNFALAAHLLACLIPIYLHGSEQQKEKYLPRLCNGELVAANAMTEPSSGSDVFTMGTRAIENKSGYLLNGEKTFISNGPVADVFVTYALTNPDKGFFGGISGFILDKHIHSIGQVTTIEKVGVRTCPLGQLSFDDLWVDSDTILGKLGGGGIIFTQSMDWERICLGAIHLGAMDRILRNVVSLVKGKNVSIDNLDLQHIADLKTKLEAATLLTYKAAWKLDQRKNVAMESSMVKLFISESYKALTLCASGICARLPFDQRNDVERSLRDSIASTIYSGTSEIHRSIVARRMGLISI